MGTMEGATARAAGGLAGRLARAGLISVERARRLGDEARDAGQSVLRYAVDNGLAPERDLATAAAEEFGLPLLDIRAVDPDPDVIRLVAEDLIRRHHGLPLFQRGNRLFVAVADPTDLHGLDEIRFHTGLMTEAILVEPSALQAAIDQSLEASNGGLEALGDMDDDEDAGLSELDDLDIDTGEDTTNEVAETEVNDAPVVRFVNRILVDAIRRGASDIHFEPYETRCRIRLRLDGVLREFAAPPIAQAPRIAARLKVMSRLDISERRVPQDGRMKIRLSRNRSVDFRVSTLPTLFGEKVVLRILDPMNARLDIDGLGMDEDQRRLFSAAIARPQGMILVTGPTGSGKTMTLYTALNQLNTADRNISTAEDPAEIYLAGINQVNIHPKAGLDFASALRSFLRQDPDVIMVGEVRDLETAEIAIKAAQTGHLVLSTVHTNDAPQTLTRLMNMGVAPYNIATSVSLIIAQRLARRLCEHCRAPADLPRETLVEAGFDEDEVDGLSVYRAVGCDHCNDGYRGRLGLFQVMPVSDAMGRIILADGNAIDIADQAEREGIPDLRRAGLRKVAEGLTTLDEINRVTRD